MQNPSFREEQDFAAAMAGIDFPTNREALVAEVRRKGVPDGIVRRFERLRDGEFDNPAQVLDASDEPNTRE